MKGLRRQKRGKFHRPVRLLQQLEERIVLDAAVNPVNNDNPANPAGSTGDSADLTNTASQPGQGSGGADASLAAAPLPDNLNQVFGTDLNVVLISNALDQVEAISHAAVDGAKVIVYDAETADLSTINSLLENIVNSAGQKIDHLALVTHGESGLFELSASQEVNPFSVLLNSASWHELGTLLDTGARIDLYGCNVGEGPMGAFLVAAVANETGAVVWASNDSTGNVDGADWNLEVRSGESTLSPLIADTALENTPINFGSYSQVWNGQCHGNGESPSYIRFEITDNRLWDADFGYFYFCASGDLDNYIPDSIFFVLHHDHYTNNVETVTFSILDPYVNGSTIKSWTIMGTELHDFFADTIATITNDELDSALYDMKTVKFLITVDLDVDSVEEILVHTCYDSSAQDNGIGMFATWNDKPYIETYLTNDYLAAFDIREDTSSTAVDLSPYFHDVEDGDNLTYSIVGNTDTTLLPASGIVIDNVNHTLKVTPAANQYGNTTITVRATDHGFGDYTTPLSVDMNFKVWVSSVNDPITSANGGIPDIIVNQNSSPTQIDLSHYFNNVEDHIYYYVQGDTNPSLFTTNGVVIPYGGQTLTLNYKPDTYGEAIITVEGYNGSAFYDSFKVTVNQYDAPYIENGGIPDIVIPETTPQTVINLSNYFDDLIEGNNLTYTITSDSNPDLFATGGVIINNETHTLTLQYAPGVYEQTELTIHAVNHQTPAMSVDDTFTVKVNAVNTSPYITSGGIPDVRAEENSSPTVIDLSQYFHDAEDGDDLTYSVWAYGWPIAGATVDNVNHTLTLTYFPDRQGTGNIEIHALDHGKGTTPNSMQIWDTFDVTVLSYNTGPYVAGGGIPDQIVPGGTTSVYIDLDDYFHDAEDGDSLTYSVASNTNEQLVYSVGCGTGWTQLNILANAHGEAQITIRGTDWSNGTDPRLYVDETFTVTVAPQVGVTSVTGLPTAVSLDEYETELFSADLTPILTEHTPLEATLTLSANHGTLTVGDIEGLTFSSGSSNGSGWVQFSGQLSDLNDALETITYQPCANYFGNDYVKVSAVGTYMEYGWGLVSWVNDTAVTAVTITPVNEQPVLNNVPAGPVTLEEDTSYFFSGISMSDPDDQGTGTLEAKATLSVSHGTLWLNWIPSGLTFSLGNENGNSTVEFAGTIQDVNLALSGFNYQVTPDFYGSDNLVVRIDDFANGGTPALSTESSVSIEVNGINESPVIVGAPTSVVSVNEDTSYTFSGISVEEPHDGDSGALQVKVNLYAGRGVLNIASVPGITFSTGLESGKHAVEFTGFIDDVNEALKALVYTPDANVSGPDGINILVNDLANGGSFPGELYAQQRISILVNPVNDSPTDITMSSTTVTENSPIGTVVGDFGKVDVDGGPTWTYSLVSGTGADDNSSFKIENGQLKTASVFDYETKHTYTTRVKVDDSAGGTYEEAMTITVLNINDAPMMENGGIPPVTVDEDAAATVINLASYYRDQEDGDNLTYSVEGDTNPGLFSAITIDNVAHTLTLNYAADRNGTADLTVRASDNGDGSSSALTLDQTFTVTVNAVNDGPVITVPRTQQTGPDGVVIFSSANGNLISVADIDAGTGPVKVTLTATHGTLSLNGVAGLTFDPGQGDGTADGTMTFTGTLSDINSSLDTMSFTHDSGYYGLADVTVTVDDQGNAGTGGPLTETSVASVSVEQYDGWFHGFGAESGWDVYNHTATGDQYFTYDMTLFWWHVSSSDTWNFWNGTAWVSTNSLGNAPYDGGFGPPNEWFHENNGVYTGYDVFIYTEQATTYFSQDYDATGATFWQLTDAGAWSYYDGSAWHATAGFNVEPTDVWFHGYGPDAGWDVYNHAGTGDEYFTHDMTLFWWHVASGDNWSFWNGNAWVSTDALGNAPYDGGYGPPNEWFHATSGAYSGYNVFIYAADLTTYFSPDYDAVGATFWQLTNAGAWSYYDGSAWYGTAGFNVEPTGVWFHGYGPDATWDVYNHTATSDEFFTQDRTVFWWHVASGANWKYWNGTAWVDTTGRGVAA